ncbi:MAG: hypothetical protein D3923_18545 [Candidatus Electrothrix sp. AR3]|nr:hypothetical protein [Candidatus Electrothrix sp. AR3]
MFDRQQWGGYLLFFLSVTLLAGCSSKDSYYGAVQFNSIPKGAEVVNLQDDASLGMTPVAVTWESTTGEPEKVTVEFVKNGYQREITSFWVNTRHQSREAAGTELQPVMVELKKRK